MGNEGHIEGFIIPVRRSLTQPILMAGAPRTATILNGTIAAALGLGLQLAIVGIIYWVVSHTICVFLARRDPQFMDVLIRHIKHKNYLT